MWNDDFLDLFDRCVKRYQSGDKDFTVHYDSKQVQPAAIVAALQAAGEKGAKVKT